MFTIPSCLALIVHCYFLLGSGCSLHVPGGLYHQMVKRTWQSLAPTLHSYHPSTAKLHRHGHTRGREGQAQTPKQEHYYLHLVVPMIMTIVHEDFQAYINIPFGNQTTYWDNTLPLNINKRSITLSTSIIRQRCATLASLNVVTPNTIQNKILPKQSAQPSFPGQFRFLFMVHKGSLHKGEPAAFVDIHLGKQTKASILMVNS